MIVADVVVMTGDNRSKLAWLSQNITADWQHHSETLTVARLLDISVPITIYMFSNAEDATHFRLRFQ